MSGVAASRYPEGCSVYVGGLDGEDEMYPEQLLGAQDGGKNHWKLAAGTNQIKENVWEKKS